MGTINPRARGGASLSGAVRALQRRDEQLGRQRVTLPKPLPPVVAAPAAPTGGVGSIGVSEALSSTYTTASNGIEFTSWAFSRHDFWPGGGGPTLQDVAPGAAEFDPTAAGWFQAHAEVAVYLSDSGAVPSFVRVEVNSHSTTNTDAGANDQRGLLTDGASRFVHAMVGTSYFYHPGPNVANHYLGVQVSWPDAPGVVVQGASVRYLLNRVA